MFVFPGDLDWLCAVIEKDPEAWDPGSVDTELTVREHLHFGYAWPPVSREALDLVPNVAYLEERDLQLAETHPDLPASSLAEALRHFRVLDKFHDPETLFGGTVFFGERTESALRLYHEACEENLEPETEWSFLFRLIYRRQGVREYVIGGDAYRLGDWTLSIPWSVVASGVVPEALRAFGRHLEPDGLNLTGDPRSEPGALELDIHDCPTSNPWLLSQTHRFLLGITSKWGWFTALDTKQVDPLVFYATCVDHAQLPEDEYEKHPLQLTLEEMDRMSRILERIEEQGERPAELAELFEEALGEDRDFPYLWPE